MEFNEDPYNMEVHVPQNVTVSDTSNLFTPIMSSYIVSMMVLEVDSGRSRDGIWNKTTWPRIQKKFNRHFKCHLSVDQVREKGKRIKKDYLTFQYLKAHTGFGWNETLKVPTAPDETWQRAHMIRGNAMKFKIATLEHYDDLHRIFGGTGATGQFSCYSTRMPNDVDDQVLHGGSSRGVSNGDLSAHDEEDMSTSTRLTSTRKGKNTLPGPSSYTNVAKKKGRNDVYDSAMQVISESSVWKGEKDKMMSRMVESVVPFTTPSPPASDPENIMTIMLRLKNSRGIDPITFANACGNLESLYNRRMFAAMDDEARIAWMKYFTPSFLFGKQSDVGDRIGRFGGSGAPYFGSGSTYGEFGGRGSGARFNAHSNDEDGRHWSGGVNGGCYGRGGGGDWNDNDDGTTGGWDAFVD